MRIGICLAVIVLAGCQGGQAVSPETAADKIVNIQGLGKQARDIVKSGLNDENSHLRTMAIEIAATSNQTELMPVVESLLSDEMVPVRFAAAIAVGDLRYRPARDAIRRVMSDKNVNVRLAAAYALTQLGDKPYDDLFLKALSNADQTVRANAAFILGKMGNKKVLPQLHAVLRDSTSSEKAMFVAVEAMAKLGDESVYPKLWAMLISTYADDRVSGIRAMGALRTIPAKNAIITMLDDKIVEVRLAAAEQLGAMGDTSGEPEVKDFFVGKSVSDAERTNRAKALAALAIGRIQTPDLTQYLPGLLASDSVGVRLAAAEAVLLIGSTDN